MSCSPFCCYLQLQFATANRSLLCLETSLDGLRCLLVAWLAKKSEHVLLVCLNTRLVEWVDAQNVAADAASLLEKVDELTKVVLVQLRYLYLDVGYATIGVGQEGAQFGHLVNLVNTLACQEVKTVQVLCVLGYYNLFVGGCHGHACLEDDALTLLYPLTH